MLALIDHSSLRLPGPVRPKPFPSVRNRVWPHETTTEIGARMLVKEKAAEGNRQSYIRFDQISFHTLIKWSDKQHN